MEARRFQLNHNWELKFFHPETGRAYRLPATVPGNVELDLARAGLITDPLPPDAEYPEFWVDLADWEYSTEFVFNGLPAGMAAAQLTFQGIDTVADVFLNDVKILESDNMFIPHRVDVTEQLKFGRNTLRVKIFAPEIAARRMPWHSFYAVLHHGAMPFLRKARHMWGWDNAPRRLSAGLWRPVVLEYLPAIRFEEVYAYTEYLHPEDDTAELACAYTFTTPDRDLRNYQLHVTLSREGQTAIDRRFPVRHTSEFLNKDKLLVKSPKLWFPAGFGEPALYDFTLTLEKEGKEVARHSHRFGIRHIRLERTETTTPEGDGEFQFYCNDQKIYVRGTNWKPLSPYHSQTPEKLHRALNLALECNCNMVRIWGGGVYEDEAFFDFCDEHGLLVWQDFMFACEYPLQDDEFLRKVAEEAESVVCKLRNHPSLALWCGNNENDMAFFWGNLVERNLLPSEERVSREVLPRAIQHFDPARPYLPSSPYIADCKVLERRKLALDNDFVLPFAPEQHIYPPAVPDEGGFRAFFKRSAAHFCSETGPIGICAMSESPEIVERELPRLRRLWRREPEEFPAENESHHQNDRYCATWCRSVRILTARMFGREFSPENPAELAEAVNFYVADLFKYAIESWRVQKFRRSGIIWWSLLDMWPMAFNYSVVDSNFRKKLPFEFIRLSQQPFALMGCDPASPGERPRLFAVNDTGRERCGTFRVELENGELLLQGKFRTAANQTEDLGELALAPGQICFLEWEEENRTGSGRNFYLSPGEPYSFEACRTWAERIRQL